MVPWYLDTSIPDTVCEVIEDEGIGVEAGLQLSVQHTYETFISSRAVRTSDLGMRFIVVKKNWK